MTSSRSITPLLVEEDEFNETDHQLEDEFQSMSGSFVEQEDYITRLYEFYEPEDLKKANLMPPQIPPPETTPVKVIESFIAAFQGFLNKLLVFLIIDLGLFQVQNYEQ